MAEHRRMEREHEQEMEHRTVPTGRESRRLTPVQPMMERWTHAGPISAAVPEERIEELEYHTQATVADAVPLGLASLAGATFTVSAINAGWIPNTGLIAAVPILIIFGGITQFIAGMWAFRKGNTFAATAFGTFGAFNSLFALAILMAANGTVPLGTVAGNNTIAVSLAMFALIAGYLAFAAIPTSAVLVAVLGFLCATYALLSVGFFAGPPNVLIILGGYAGVISSLIAFYASAAIVINSASRREVLPY